MATSSYIDRGGELVYQPPFIAKDVGYYGFILDADKEKLQELCDRYLNSLIGGDRRFVPAGSFVLLACCDLPELQSSTKPYQDMGSFAEREMALWLLLIDKVQERLYWFLPYIFVDNAYAMAMGRELYGFPKSIGTISIPASLDHANEFALDTLVLKRYSAQSRGEVVRLIEVRESSDVYVGASGAWQDLGSLVKEIVRVLDEGFQLLSDIKLFIQSMDDLLQLRIPMVFLKQARDVVQPSRAVYQEIVETTPFSPHVYEGRILASHYDIIVEQCDSQPICVELGLATNRPLRSKISFYVNFDFEIGLGTTLTLPIQPKRELTSL
jgi:hypothetical protein